MSLSPRNPIDRDSANWFATAASGALILVLGVAVAGFGARSEVGATPGNLRIYPELRLRIAPVPMPAIAASPPEPMAAPPSDMATAPMLEPAPVPVLPPEPMAELDPAPVPTVAAQAPVETEGEAGKSDAIRAEWLAQLRRRIEESKFYPGAARYSRETGTVLLRVRIGPAGEIGAPRVLENTGSTLLGEGALAILRRAAAKSLGTNTLPAGFEVDVPISYRFERR